MGEEFQGTVHIAANWRDPVSISSGPHPIITVPVVRVHLGAFFHTVGNEPEKTVTGGVWYMPQPNTPYLLPVQFDRDRYQGFPNQLPTADARLFSSYVGFIHFYRSAQEAAFHPDCRLAKLLQHKPCSLVPHLQIPLKRLGTDAGFLRA